MRFRTFSSFPYTVFNWGFIMNHSRYIVFILFIIHLGLLFSCSRKSPTAPCIVFNDTICHLSLKNTGGQALGSAASPVEERCVIDSFDFVYSNAGDKKLVIYSVAPSCDCLTATFEQKLLAKGESSYIRIYFDATNEHGDFWRTLDVYTNARKEPYTLEVEGTIE